MTGTSERGEWCLARSCGVGASVERSDGGVPRDPVTGWIPAFGDLCIISFLPLQGEVPKAEGVLLRQALSGTRARRTPSVAPRQLPLRGEANYSKGLPSREWRKGAGRGYD